MTTPSKRFEIFAGTYVRIVTRLKATSQNRAVGILSIDGFLLDEDEHCYFLGSTPDEITDSVLKSDTVRMYLPIEEMMELIGSSHQGSEEMN